MSHVGPVPYISQQRLQPAKGRIYGGKRLSIGYATKAAVRPSEVGFFVF